MTRQDRAALVLALHYARERGQWWAGAAAFSLERSARRAVGAVLRLLVGHTVPGLDDLWDALQTAGNEGTPQRLLRARLALCIRALLRVDAGDFGRWRGCDACVYCKLDHGRSKWANGWRRLCSSNTRRITPWWEQAPGTATRPAGLNRR